MLIRLLALIHKEFLALLKDPGAGWCLSCRR